MDCTGALRRPEDFRCDVGRRESESRQPLDGIRIPGGQLNEEGCLNVHVATDAGRAHVRTSDGGTRLPSRMPERDDFEETPLCAVVDKISHARQE